MRETYKRGRGWITDNSLEYGNLHDYQRCVQKLGQLEDILDKYKLDSPEDLDKHIEDCHKLISALHTTIQPCQELEEELGIDLLLYLNVMVKGLVWVKGMERRWGGIGTKKDIAPYYVEHFDKNELIVRFSNNHDPHIITNPVEKYGTLWAISEEELL